MKNIKGNPWIFVPVLYFLQGAPYFVITDFSLQMFKKLGIANDSLTFWIAMISWPWVIKPLWSPIVDSFGSKRRWLFSTQSLNVLCMLGLAWAATLENAWVLSLVLLFFAAIVSATHDIVSDGFYLLSLSHTQRSFFVGLSSTFYRMARIFVTGAMVAIAGVLNETRGLPTSESWSKALLLGAGVYAFAMFLGSLSFPTPKEDSAPKTEKIAWSVFKDYFTQKNIAVIVFFILFYRFGESMVGVMSGLFFMDPAEKGGMGLSTVTIGSVRGVVGVIALSLGGIIGGVTLSRWGLKRCLFPMLVMMYVPNLFYIWASLAQPAASAVYGIVFVDQFGYGFGFTAYMVFMMYITQNSPFKTSHYAISTGLMALGANIAGMVSGKLQMFLSESLGDKWGYPAFFLGSFLICIPGIILARKLPLEGEDVFESDVVV